MPAKKKSRSGKASSRRKSTTRAAGTTRSSKKARGKGRSGGGKTSKLRATGMKKAVKRVGARALAGAVAGAVKAIIPPLEEAAGASERASGIGTRGENGQAGRGNKSTSRKKAGARR